MKKEVGKKNEKLSKELSKESKNQKGDNPKESKKVRPIVEVTKILTKKVAGKGKRTQIVAQSLEDAAPTNEKQQNTEEKKSSKINHRKIVNKI